MPSSNVSPALGAFNTANSVGHDLSYAPRSLDGSEQSRIGSCSSNIAHGLSPIKSLCVAVANSVELGLGTCHRRHDHHRTRSLQDRRHSSQEDSTRPISED